jgi:prepilin-type N-terminal cleavage/methylation domain-containing protein
MTRQAFTLAEMMIVLLVMAIILAAFAPLMTRRMKSNISAGGSGGGESLWAELATNGPGIYYGTGNAESVIIGAATKATTDNARLILNKGANTPNYILFKDGSNTIAGLYIDGSRIYFGNVPADKTGTYNIGFGRSILSSNTTGSYNTGVGHGVLSSNTTGGGNIGVGYETLVSNTAGNYNLGVGFYTLMLNTTGGANVGVGSFVLSPTTGNGNTGVGYSALQSSTTGSYNTGLGYLACGNVTTGSNKTCIGANSGPTGTPNTTNSTNQVWIGVSGSEVYIPGSLEVSGTFTNPSDKRLKNIKGENTSGLEKIKQIKVFNYTLKDDKAKTPRVGVIAQDLQKIFPDAVSKGYEGFLAVRTEDILYALVNAVKELDKNIKEILWETRHFARNQEISAKVVNQVQNDAAAVQTRVAKLEKENKQLKAQNKALEARLSGLEAKIK